MIRGKQNAEMLAAQLFNKCDCHLSRQISKDEMCFEMVHGIYPINEYTSIDH